MTKKPIPRSGRLPAGLPPNREAFEPGNVPERMEVQRRIRHGGYDSIPGMRTARRVVPIALAVVLVAFLLVGLIAALTS